MWHYLSTPYVLRTLPPSWTIQGSPLSPDTPEREFRRGQDTTPADSGPGTGGSMLAMKRPLLQRKWLGTNYFCA